MGQCPAHSKTSVKGQPKTVGAMSLLQVVSTSVLGEGRGEPLIRMRGDPSDTGEGE